MPVWRSPIIEAIRAARESGKLRKATGAQWKGYLKKNGVGADELEWYDLDQYGESVTADQLLQDIERKGTTIAGEVTDDAVGYRRDITLDPSAPDLIGEETAGFGITGSPGGTKWNEYTLEPVGQSPEYLERRVLGNRPRNPVPDDPQIKAIEARVDELGAEMARVAEESGTDLAQLILPNTPNPAARREYLRLLRERDEAASLLSRFRYPDQGFSSHSYPEKDMLWWSREGPLDIPDVGPSWHLEELQSDLHQQGRKSGYQKGAFNFDDWEILGTDLTPDRVPRVNVRHRPTGDKRGFVLPSNLWDNPSPEQMNAYLRTQLSDASLAESTTDLPPNLPYKSSWTEKGLMRTLYEAVDRGYPRVSWTGGQAQLDRYPGTDPGLAKYYDEVVERTFGKIGKRHGAVPQRTDLAPKPDEYPELPGHLDYVGPGEQEGLKRYRYTPHNPGPGQDIYEFQVRYEDEALPFAQRLVFGENQPQVQGGYMDITPSLAEWIKKGVPLGAAGGAVGLGALAPGSAEAEQMTHTRPPNPNAGNLWDAVTMGGTSLLTFPMDLAVSGLDYMASAIDRSPGKVATEGLGYENRAAIPLTNEWATTKLGGDPNTDAATAGLFTIGMLPFGFGGAGGIVKGAGRLPGSLTVEGVHFSHTPGLKFLDASRYGTGIPGAEAGRLSLLKPEDRYRVYGYHRADQKEVGLGPHEYRFTADDVYDAKNDPEGIIARAEERAYVPEDAQYNPGTFDNDAFLNGFEMDLKAAGYGGYSTDQGIVMFRNVDVTPVGGPPSGGGGGRLDRFVPEDLNPVPTVVPENPLIPARKTAKRAGFPPTVRGPKTQQALDDRLFARVFEGLPGRAWYDRSSAEARSLTGDRPGYGARFTGLVGITSADNAMPQNRLAAVRGFNQGLVGDPILAGRYPEANRPTAEELWRGGEARLGPKTGAFYEALNVRAGGGVERPTNDVWMARAFGFDGRSITDAQHRYMDETIRRLTDRANKEALGGHTDWTPERTQAAIWTSIKAEQENIPIARAAQDFGPEFWDPLTVNIATEATPGASTGHLTGLGANPAANERLARDQRAVLTDDQGRDLLALQEGALTRPTVSGPGAYRGETNPADVIPILGSPGVRSSSLGPADRRVTEALAGAHGLLRGQNSVGYNYLRPAKAAADRNAADLNLGRTISTSEMRTLSASLAERFGDDVATTHTANGVRLLYFGDDRKAFEAAAKAAGTDLGGEVSLLQNSGDLVGADTYKPSVYLQKIEAAGPEVEARLDRGLRSLAPQLEEIDARLVRDFPDVGERAAVVRKVREGLRKGGLAELKKMVKAGTLPAAALAAVLAGEQEAPALEPTS